jgi:type III pantothenate kinase
MTFLAIDIGNSNIKTGIFSGNTLTAFNVFGSLITFKEYFLSLKEIDKAAISSVVPLYTSEIKEFIEVNNNISPYVISHQSRFNIEIRYDTPETLGIDRICSCEGAIYLLKQKQYKNDGNHFIVTSDLGTATTVNIVKNGNGFIGGVIAPGIFTMADSLNKNTAQLPKIEFGDYKDFIGKTTMKSIESGIINSTLGLYYMTFEYLNSLDRNANIHFFITGGNAGYIIPHLKLDHIYVEELVLLGIKIICEKNLND